MQGVSDPAQRCGKTMLCSLHLHATSILSALAFISNDRYIRPVHEHHSVLVVSAANADINFYDGRMVLLQDGHTTVSWYQLSHWEDCPKWDGFTASSYTAGSTTVSFANSCEYFTVGGYSFTLRITEEQRGRTCVRQLPRSDQQCFCITQLVR
jgi:hypothetical protein